MQLLVLAGILTCFFVNQSEFTLESTAEFESANPLASEQLLSVGLCILIMLACSSAICLLIHLSGGRLQRSGRDSTLMDQRFARGELASAVVWFGGCLFIALETEWSAVSRLAGGGVGFCEILVFITPILIGLCANWFVFAWSSGGTWMQSVTQVWIRVRLYVFALMFPLLIFTLFSDLLNWLQLENEWFQWGSCLLFLLGIIVVMPTFLTWILPSRSIRATELGRQLMERARQISTPVNDIRVWYTGNRVVNALITGIVPWNRTVFLSDRLICLMELREIESVFFHEISHARRMHLFLRFLAGAVPFLLVHLVFVQMIGSELAGLIAGGLAGVVCLGMVAKQLEYDADRSAIELEKKFYESDYLAGFDRKNSPFCSAMEKIRIDNPAADQSSWMHPTISQRVNYLCTRSW